MGLLGESIIDARRYNTSGSGSFKVVLELGWWLSFFYRTSRLMSKTGRMFFVFYKLIDFLSKILTSCHVSYKAEIAAGIKFPHATGIVIGEGVKILGGVTIYQGVTIGQINGTYPVLEEGVVLYPGVVVVGGVRIGKGAVIAPNVVVRENVEPFSVVRDIVGAK